VNIGGLRVVGGWQDGLWDRCGVDTKRPKHRAVRQERREKRGVSSQHILHKVRSGFFVFCGVRPHAPQERSPLDPVLGEKISVFRTDDSIA